MLSLKVQNNKDGTTINIYCLQSDFYTTPARQMESILEPKQNGNTACDNCDESYIVVSRYSSCSADCTSSGKKHYHCKQCNYSTEKSDRIKKHENTHQPHTYGKDMCKQHFTALKRCYKIAVKSIIIYSSKVSP